jgi:hypothetical protein
MSPTKILTKPELIIDVWERLDCESVGARELAEIQRSVSDQFGAGAVDSPATVARLLADEGAVLRHPEVIDYDSQWRAQGFADEFFPAAANFESLREAVASIRVIDERRQELEAECRELDLARLRQTLLSVRKDRLLVARSKVVNARQRLEANEIAEWLRVWLEAPDLFNDWLELRQRSADYLGRFG